MSTEDEGAKAPAKKAAPRKAAAKKAAAKKTPAKKAAKKAPTKTVRKRPAKKTVAVVEPEPTSIVEVVIGNRTYPLIFDPSCVICRHPKRALIEEQILYGTRFAAIAREFSGRVFVTLDRRREMMPEISAEQVSNHYKLDHSPLDASTLQDFAEQAVELSEYEEVGKRAINGLSFVGSMIDRVNQRVVRGEIEPTVKDGIAAARVDVGYRLAQAAQSEAESDTGEIVAEYEQAIKAIYKAVREVVTPEQREAFIERLRSNEVLNRIFEKNQNQPRAVSAREEQSA